MTDLIAEKKAARVAAVALRAALPSAGLGRQAAGHALAAVGALREVRVVSAYLPMRGEIDPRPAMLALAGLGYRVCAPVVEARGAPLRFRAWTPRAALVNGSFGAQIPACGDWVDPDALLVPLLAFDARGWRLGYGGGFYDRTLVELRAHRRVVALGFAYAGQEVETVPHGPHDAPLDAVVTEAGVLRPG